MQQPNFVLTIIPPIDGIRRICELVRYCLEDISIREAWQHPPICSFFDTWWRTSPGCPCSKSSPAAHFDADLTLGYGEVVFD